MSFIQDYKAGRSIRKSQGQVVRVAVTLMTDGQIEVAVTNGDTSWGALGSVEETIEFFKETVVELEKI